MNNYKLLAYSAYNSVKERIAYTRDDLKSAETVQQKAVCLGTFARSLMHNPFAQDDLYNKKLTDRHMSGLIGKNLEDLNELTNRGPDASRYSPAVEARLKVLGQIRENLGDTNRIHIPSLAVFIDACVGLNSDVVSILFKLYSTDLIVESLEDQIESLELKKCNETPHLAVWRLRETLDAARKAGTEINADFVQNIKQRVEELNIDRPDESFGNLYLDERTEALINVMKLELLFNGGLYAMEMFLSTFSSSLSFSLITSLGFTSFSISLFIVLASLPKAVAYMEGAWRQLAAAELPSLDMAKKNVYEHVQESWEKAVYTDKSFHPIASAFLDTLIVSGGWAALASCGFTSHAVFYLFLDGYLSIKASLILEKDKLTSQRDFAIASISGITRGIFKNLHKTSIFLKECNTTFYVARSFYDAVITFNSAIFGHIMNLGLTQLCPVDRFQELMTLAQKKFQEMVVIAQARVAGPSAQHIKTD